MYKTMLASLALHGFLLLGLTSYSRVNTTELIEIELFLQKPTQFYFTRKYAKSHGGDFRGQKSSKTSKFMSAVLPPKNQLSSTTPNNSSNDSITPGKDDIKLIITRFMGVNNYARGAGRYADKKQNIKNN